MALYNSDQLEYLPGRWERSRRTSWTWKCFHTWICMGKRHLDHLTRYCSELLSLKGIVSNSIISGELKVTLQLCLL